MYIVDVDFSVPGFVGVYHTQLSTDDISDENLINLVALDISRVISTETAKPKIVFFTARDLADVAGPSMDDTPAETAGVASSDLCVAWGKVDFHP